jgi:hypothetical protein
LSSLLPADNANTICSGTAKSTVLSAAEASPQSTINNGTSAIPKGEARSSNGGIGVTGGEDVKSLSHYSLFDALSSEEAEWCGVHHGKGLKQGVSSGGGGSLNWRASIRKALPWPRKNGRSSSNNNNNINYYSSSKPFVAEERQDTSLRIT